MSQMENLWLSRVRPVRPEELEKLLTLYTFLGDNPLPENLDKAEQVWTEILENPGYRILVLEQDGRLISSCTLLIIPNLTHHQRPYALVENVVTHPDYRGRGCATAVLDYARALARQAGCYKIMLLTGSKRESTLSFYRHAGYRDDLKTGFCQKLDG